MQKNPNPQLLLDTHIFIWLMNGDKSLHSNALAQMDALMEDGAGIAISSISLWEISMLYSRKRILLNQPCLNWLAHSLQAPNIYVADLTPEIAVESCSLPNSFHGDPADRIILATARVLDVPLMTRDEKILDYAKRGFVKCIKG